MKELIAMIINNKEISTRIRLGIMLFMLIFVALLVLSLIFNWSSSNKFELIITIVFFVTMTYIFLRRFCYVYYNNEGPKVVLRFSPLQPLTYGNYSIEFYKKDFVKYEVESSYFGIRKSLIIYIRTPQGVAKFQPVSLATLTPKEISEILSSLDKYKNNR